MPGTTPATTRARDASWPSTRHPGKCSGSTSSVVPVRTNWGKDVAVDAAGNVYVVGYFEGTVDFDPSPGAWPT